MLTPNLWIICATAFAAVATLLAVLAATMRLILFIFPHQEKSTDAVVLAAVASVIQNLYPGTQITKVEEIR